MRTDPAAICFRLTAAQMSVIWPGLDLIIETYAVRQQNKRVLYAYPFRLYPPSAGFDRGAFDTDMMGHVIAMGNALRSKAMVGGRVQMNCIQIRAAIFAVRVNQGRWRRRNYDVRRRNADTKRKSIDIYRTKVELGDTNAQIEMGPLIEEQNLEPLQIKSERVVRSLERHMKRANRLLQSLVSREDYAAFMDAWNNHLRWMRLRLVYFKPLLPRGVRAKRSAQYILNRLEEIAGRGLHRMRYQPPEAWEMRKMMRLYVQYARRGREPIFTLPFLLRNEKDVAAAKHLAYFVLRRLTLRSRPQP